MNQPMMSPPEWIESYEALTRRVGLVDLGHRTQIELLGADRASFLHNLCTNEVRRLAAGAGCEAFLTTVQGKTLVHGLIFNLGDSLLFDTVAGESEKILKHLDHYLVCERVTLEDRSTSQCELFLGGPDASDLVDGWTLGDFPEARLASQSIEIEGCTVSVPQADLAGPTGFLLSATSEELPKLRAVIERAGVARCGEEAFHAARIEWGFPWAEWDVSDKNLPQELARDALAISFVKGCYLGQETVARIDALGHVNKTLVGFRFQGPTVPPRGCELFVGDQAVGNVTSASFSPRLGAPLALGFARRGSNAPGTRLASEFGEAEVVTLPITEPLSR